VVLHHGSVGVGDGHDYVLQAELAQLVDIDVLPGRHRLESIVRVAAGGSGALSERARPPCTHAPHAPRKPKRCTLTLTRPAQLHFG